MAARLTRSQVFAQSWPIILANAAIGLAGIIDTFVLGRFAPAAAMAGIGAGAAIYGVIYWGFGFLRMTTAGLSAQAEGSFIFIRRTDPLRPTGRFIFARASGVFRPI